MNHQRVFYDPVPPGLGDLERSQQTMPSGLSLPPRSLLSGSFGSSTLLPPLGNLGPQSQTQGAPQAAKGPTSLAHCPLCLAVWLLSAVPTPGVRWQQTEAGPCLPPPPITSFRFLRCRGSRKDKFNFLESPSNFFWKLLPFFDWGGGGRNEEVNSNIANFLSKLATCSHWLPSCFRELRLYTGMHLL